ncbi:MotA/TolQ/ExbB proton channel family protein [Aureisphaera galaxeae]|uniref:MotA/TolQ/ExbB proton channel family protein n=1 Tax=Aureisphaera galaxeae TaxID=1538023 RepID=UPI0023505ABD|nr:MotA/TolQ/ExbB proton channel family protein [Aureisphaera galaxeae]MDC8005510.1 MotA/TolQ/ExbB proton channel family protein [Aureisphaera galaxeae]
MSQLFDRISEGGPVFMIPLVLIILFIVGLLIYTLVLKRNKEKVSRLIGHISLFGMMWGFLGSSIGLISAFDAIDASGTVSQPMMAGGLKVALLATVFGLVTFLIGRLSMIVLHITSE